MMHEQRSGTGPNAAPLRQDRSGQTVSDAVVARIAADGIDTVFGVTGGGIMYLVDAVARSEVVQLQSMHHEQFAGVAADGYARSGKPYGVAFATTGPGAANLFTAVVAAWQDSSPVIFVVGQVKSADSSHLTRTEIRQNGTFEFDTTEAFRPICKGVEIVRRAEDIHAVLAASINRCTSGRPGPVVIEIPLDVQGALIGTPETIRPSEPTHSESTTPSRQAAMDSLSVALERAMSTCTRPLVLLGSGVVRAGMQERITDALDLAGIPYIVTQFARQAGQAEHPLFLGSPGIKANRSANLALTECDVLIALGTSLHQQVVGWDGLAFSSLPSWKIWCELDEQVISARHRLVDEAFNLSVESATPIILSQVQKRSTMNAAQSGWEDWRNRCTDLRSRALLHYPMHDEVPGKMCLYRVVSVLSRFSHSFRSAVTDAGVVWYALAQHYFCQRGSHFISSGSFGAMGMALPMAIGSAYATRGRVLALTGDGSLMTCLSEMASLSQSGLPVVLVINNNDGYLSIRTTHDRYFEGRRIGTDRSNGVLIPRVEELASTFGLSFRSVTTEAELERVLREVTHEAWTEPVVIEVMTYVDQAVEPIVESKRGPDGTFLSSTLADMSPPWSDDRGD